LPAGELQLFEKVFFRQSVGNMAQTVLGDRDGLWPRILSALQYQPFPIIHCRHLVA
jgi:hypothetical protein